MTKLVTLSGNGARSPLYENPLQYNNIALGMLFWKRVLDFYPDLTFADIKRFRTATKARTYEPNRLRGFNLFRAIGNTLSDIKDGVGDVANWIADTSEDATRLIFLEESESGKTAIGGIIDGVAAYYSSGASTMFKSENGDGEGGGGLMDQILGFFRGTGEAVRQGEAGGYNGTSTAAIPKEYLWIGGGALAFVALMLILK